MIKKDITVAEKQCSQVSTKVADSIEKLQEVNANLVKMITIHEQKHDQHDKTEDSLKNDIKELHTRITTVNKEFHEKLEEVEENLSKKLDGYGKKLDELMIRSNPGSEHSVGTNKNLISILSDFDRWRWMIVGPAIVV